MSHLGFTTFETAFPEAVYTNNDPPFLYYPATCGKLGITQRHIAQHETVASLAVDCIEKLRSSVADAFGDFDALVLSTTSYESNQAEIIQRVAEEVAKRTHIDVVETVNFACSGFAAAVEKALRMCEEYGHVAVACSEISSVGLDYAEYKTFPLFGDGAAAGSISPKGKHRIIKAFAESISDSTNCIGHRDGVHLDITQKRKIGRTFRMSGAEVMRKALAIMSEITFRESNERDGSKVIVPHQAGTAILEKLQSAVREKKFEWPVINRLEKTGNLVSASVPAALSSVFKEGKIPHGTHVVCPTFGGGEALQNGWMSKGLVSFIYDGDAD